MKLPKYLCPIPWISLEVETLGTFAPCCQFDSNMKIKGKDGQPMSIAKGDTIQQAFNSEDMIELRKSFMRGERPQGCQACWVEESVPGRLSKRLNSYSKFRPILKDIDWEGDDHRIRFLDLKLGNICNLKCRICGAWSSSKWVQETIDIGFASKDVDINSVAKKGQWPRHDQAWVREIESLLDGILFFEFAGGEPFLIQQQFDLLKLAKDKGYASKIDVHYNTNGTVFPPEALEGLWKDFKRVEIAFSIDDIGDRFEYQRKGANWEEVLTNLKSFIELKESNDNLNLQICTTINSQNIYYYDELLPILDELGFEDVYFNLLQNPPEYYIANLPQTAKDAILEKYNNIKLPKKWQRQFDMILEVLKQNGIDMSAVLKKRLRIHDDYRNEDFSQSHPEIARLIDYAR